ncbi:MAG: disulfide bond formation protein B [Porticoccaceae bacterium]
MPPSPRIVNLALALSCTGLILTALYLQQVMELLPCYLCIVQRVFVILCGASALAAFLHNPAAWGRRLYGVVVTLFALGGAGFSLRHLWLQSLPKDQVPTCGPPAEYLLDAFPLAKALPMLLKGDGNCAAIDWSLFGISIPGWTLVAFIGLATAGIWQVVRTR